MMPTYPRTQKCSSRLRSWDVLPWRTRRAGKRVHAHGLRHTYAVDLRKENVDVGIISKALGHSNIGTTSTCLNHVRPRDVIEALWNRGWSGTEVVVAARNGTK